MPTHPLNLSEATAPSSLSSSEAIHYNINWSSYATTSKQLDYPSAVLTDKPSQSSETWIILSWVNDRVGGPCQPPAWTGTLTTLQFTPSGQRGMIERRKDEVDDRRNEAVNQMSAKTKGELWKYCQIDLTTETEALSMTSIFLCEMKF